MPNFFRPSPAFSSQIQLMPPVAPTDTCGELSSAPDLGVDALPEPWRSMVKKAITPVIVCPPPTPYDFKVPACTIIGVDPRRLEALAVQLDNCGQHVAATQVRTPTLLTGITESR